jgi:dihydropteroate synthase
MSDPVARAWDLVEPGDAASFLRPEGLEDRATGLPLPCRALWAPRGFIDPGGLGPLGAAGLVVLDGRRGSVVCGPAARLREAAASWPAGAALVAALDHYERPASRLRFAGGRVWDFTLGTRIMGVLNVTPDSFSDGGQFSTPAAALRRAARLLEEGADIVDVGGESTRPGPSTVSVDEELRRVGPVLAALRREFPRARISVDTRRAAVAREALAAGADLINDISALSDPEMGPLAAEANVPVALMHMRGTPATMQQQTEYEDLVGAVAAFLAERVDRAREAGIADDRILADPGLGFGKSAEGNELLLRQLRSLHSLGRPLLVGASRKAFLGLAAGVPAPAERVSASVAAAVVAALFGAAVVRVHDVAATREALAVAARIRPPWTDGGNS